LETTERIVEAYARYAQGWATLPNIRCDGQLVADGRLVFGTWKQLFHLECDVKPRSRMVVVTVAGE
jgi:hypothetical protein